MAWAVALVMAGLVLGWDSAPSAQGSVRTHPYYLLGAASTNATVVSGCRPTSLHAADIVSIDATPVYVRFYNTCGTPTSASIPVLVLAVPGVPAMTAASLGRTSFTPAQPLYFPTGLSLRITTGIAVDNDDAISAAEVIVNLATD